MKIIMLASVVVLTTFVSSLFSSFGKMVDKSISAITEGPDAVIVVTGDNDSAVAEKISAHLYENYSSVKETTLEEDGRVDTAYSFSASIFGDRKLNKLLETSMCVTFYQDLINGPSVSFCGLVGHQYVYHLKYLSIDNTFSRFKGNNYTHAMVYDYDPGSGTCNQNNKYAYIGNLVSNWNWNWFTMNDRISCLEVNHY